MFLLNATMRMDVSVRAKALVETDTVDVPLLPHGGGRNNEDNVSTDVRGVLPEVLVSELLVSTVVPQIEEVWWS